MAKRKTRRIAPIPLITSLLHHLPAPPSSPRWQDGMICYSVDAGRFVTKRDFPATSAPANLLSIEILGEARIPTEHRTIPLTLRRAAELLGKTGGKKDAAAWLRARIDKRAYFAEKISRQQWVFDIRDFPEIVHSKLRSR